MADQDDIKLAVLIDADNAQSSVIHALLAEVSRYGTATIKRAYGDWTTPNLKGWKEVLHTMAIQPIQQFSYTTGRNSTDASLIIDAMDLLYSGNLDGFCLVSSDSDFTRLATRIRKFIHTELLRPSKSKASVTPPDAEPLKKALSAAIDAATRDDGWAPLSTVGSMLLKNNPAFDPRSYGFDKLGALVRKQPYLDVKEIPVAADSTTVHLYVRLKAGSS